MKVSKTQQTFNIRMAQKHWYLVTASSVRNLCTTFVQEINATTRILKGKKYRTEKVLKQNFNWHAVISFHSSPEAHHRLDCLEIWKSLKCPMLFVCTFFLLNFLAFFRFCFDTVAAYLAFFQNSRALSSYLRFPFAAFANGILPQFNCKFAELTSCNHVL